MTAPNIVELIEQLAADAVAAGVDCVERSPGHYGPSREAEDALDEAKWRLLIAIVNHVDDVAGDAYTDGRLEL